MKERKMLKHRCNTEGVMHSLSLLCFLGTKDTRALLSALMHERDSASVSLSLQEFFTSFQII